jgi:hypothetical protein
MSPSGTHWHTDTEIDAWILARDESGHWPIAADAFAEGLNIKPHRFNGRRSVLKNRGQLHTKSAVEMDRELEEARRPFDLGQAAVIRLEGLAKPPERPRELSEGPWEPSWAKGWPEAQRIRLDCVVRSVREYRRNFRSLWDLSGWSEQHILHCAGAVEVGHE